MNPNRHARTLLINSLEVLDERIVPSSMASSVAAHEAALAAKTPIAIDVHFSGVTSKTLKSFEKELTSDKVKLGSISLKTDVAVGAAPRSELAAIAKLKHVTNVSAFALSVPKTPATPVPVATTMTTPSASTQIPDPVATPTSSSSGSTFAAVAKSIAGDPTINTPTPTSTPMTSTTPTVSTSPTTPLLSAKGGAGLATIYSEYEADVQAGSTFTPTASQTKLYYISGTSIQLEVSVAAGNLNAMVATLEQLGMTNVMTAVPGQVGIIEGSMPIAQLPTVAENANVIGMPPALRPTVH
jgi:hypothetical protein